MNTFNLQKFIDKIPEIKFSTDVQNTWDQMDKAVLANAQLLHQDRINCSESGSAFNDWWLSCCELFSARQIIINKLNFDSSESEDGEYIELFNTGPMIVDLTDWKINAGNEGQDMIFPKGTLIHPKSKLRIYTNKDQSYSFNSKQSVWNNKGDKAFLFDKSQQLICTWAYGEKAHKDVFINHIYFDGQEKYTESDEYVEIENLSSNYIDISNWLLSAGKNQEFIFPQNAILKPNAKIKVYTNHLDINSGGYSFNSKKAVWNNKSDIGILFDYKRKQVCEYKYG